MPLSESRRKRDFERTPEPHSKPARRPGKLFVVHQHAASRLHYDFRLELDGVLKSWAVPKGPSLDPGKKRLAVEVEDHPLDYAFFEGVIPENESGGGAVLVWDRGRWRPEGDPHAGLRAGKLVFELDGEKLHGRWALVRLDRTQGGKSNWLLMKLADEAARRRGDVLLQEPASVVSGRDLPAMARAKARVGSLRSGEVRARTPRRRSPKGRAARRHPRSTAARDAEDSPPGEPRPADRHVELAT